VILHRSQVASQAAIHRLSPARSHLPAPRPRLQFGLQQ
jgi:hypothetical protein